MGKYLVSLGVAASLFAAQATPLSRATPESVGIDPAAIRDFVAELERITLSPDASGNGLLGALMIVKDGRVIAETAWEPWSLEIPRQVYSMSKSFTATAIGFAVQEGLLKVEDPVVKFFPDQVPDPASENLKAMTVRDLLTMQTGHGTDPIGGMFDFPSGMAAGFLASDVPHRPGTRFLYENAATYMLSAILHQMTGQSLTEYLRPRLFDPCGIGRRAWDSDHRGVNFGAWGLRILPEDAAKLGLLYLQKGRWNGRQLLTEEWVNTALSPLTNVKPDEPARDWNRGYGYQFWCCRDNAYRADGMLGQYAVILPEENAVAVLFSTVKDMAKPLDLIQSDLRPALRGRRSEGPSMTGPELAAWLLPQRSLGLADAASPAFPDGEWSFAYVPKPGEKEQHRVTVKIAEQQFALNMDGWQPEFRRGVWTKNTGPDETFFLGKDILIRLFATRRDEVRIYLVSPREASYLEFILTNVDGLVQIRHRNPAAGDGEYILQNPQP